MTNTVATAVAMVTAVAVRSYFGGESVLWRWATVVAIRAVTPDTKNQKHQKMSNTLNAARIVLALDDLTKQDVLNLLGASRK